MPFAGGSLVLDPTNIELVNPAKRPFVDPLRDTGAPDEKDWLLLAPELEGEWAGALHAWEHSDAFLAGVNPGPAWLRQRMRQAVAPGARLWWELKGLRDAGDLRRYGSEMWAHPMPVTVYLGWHSYVVEATGATLRCPACGGFTIQGRQYCGPRDCDRARAVARKRLSRSNKGLGTLA
jgi:hypothetical protein